MPRIKNDKEYLDIEIGKFELMFNKNYRLLTIINDLTLGLLYVTGSILFMFESTQDWAMAAYLIGGIQLTSRPILKLCHASYLRRVSNRAARKSGTHEQKTSKIKTRESSGGQTISTIKKKKDADEN